MGKGWFLSALLVALCGCVAYAREDGAPGADPAGATAAPRGSVFPAERLSEEFDRLSQKGDRRAVAGTSDPADSTPDLGSFIAKLAVSLLVILGGIYAASHALKRYGRLPLMHAAGPLKVLARHSLTSKSSLYVVAALDRFLIIGESPQGLTVLSQFTDPEENLRLREKWGWDSVSSSETGALRQTRNATFAPALQSHVDELERELSRLREAH